MCTGEEAHSGTCPVSSPCSLLSSGNLAVTLSLLTLATSILLAGEMTSGVQAPSLPALLPARGHLAGETG